MMLNSVAIHFQISAAPRVSRLGTSFTDFFGGSVSELLAWGLYLDGRTPTSGVSMVQSWRLRWWMPCSRERRMELHWNLSMVLSWSFPKSMRVLGNARLSSSNLFVKFEWGQSCDAVMEHILSTVFSIFRARPDSLSNPLNAVSHISLLFIHLNHCTYSS
jgi:hypothetical protein